VGYILLLAHIAIAVNYKCLLVHLNGSNHHPIQKHNSHNYPFLFPNLCNYHTPLCSEFKIIKQNFKTIPNQTYFRPSSAYFIFSVTPDGMPTATEAANQLC